MMSFVEFQDCGSYGGDLTEFVEDVLLQEGITISPSVAKIGAVGILMKMSQLRQKIEQDGTAGNAEKSLAGMLFLVASMQALAIGVLGGDPGLVSRASSGSR